MELGTIYCGDSRGIPITRKLIGACVGAFLPPCVVAIVTAVWRESTLVAMLGVGGTNGCSRCHDYR